LVRKKEIMDYNEIDRVLSRISHEILEKNNGVSDLILVGIRTRGVPLAGRIADKLASLENEEIPVGVLDITLYRDDLDRGGARPVVHRTDIPFDINDKKLVLVDDVLYTGRTARAAMDALIDLGRPRYIQLAILIDRGHRELPIRADYIGRNIPTSRNEIVEVLVEEVDEEDRILIYEDKD